MDPSYKTIRTPLLEIAYLEHGPADGKPLILLHGWPDSPQTWSALLAPLAERGWRVLMPAQRGCAATRFLETATLRSGQLTALAQDALLLHGELDRATLAQTTEGENKYFAASYQRQVVARAGHFIQREKPQAVLDAILSHTNV